MILSISKKKKAPSFGAHEKTSRLLVSGGEPSNGPPAASAPVSPVYALPGRPAGFETSLQTL